MYVRVMFACTLSLRSRFLIKDKGEFTRLNLLASTILDNFKLKCIYNMQYLEKY